MGARVLLVSLVLLASGAPARDARAAPALLGEAAENQRTSLYRDGINAAALGHWAEARDRFAAAVALRPSPKVFFSLAQSEEHLGLVASALADYQRSLEGARAVSGESDVVAAAEQAERALEPRVPHIRVTLANATRASATLDELPVPVGETIALDPGMHRLVVTAPEGRASVNVAIGERERLDVPVRLEVRSPETSTTPPETRRVVSPGSEPERPTRRASVSRIVGPTATGLGVVALGMGAYFGWEAKTKNDESMHSGCTGDSCSAAGAAVRHSALSEATASTVAFTAGALLAASGLLVWIAFGSSSSPRRVAVTPTTFGSGGGITARGSF